MQDKVHAIVDKDGKREVKVIASGLHRPNGIALHKGTLYIAELTQISKIDNIEDKLDNPPKPTVILSDLPKDEPHGWKYLTVGPDKKLYFQVGAPCNICMPSERHAKICRVGLDGKGLEVYARGIRQIVGMDWHPTSEAALFLRERRDWLSEDMPEDKLNRVTQPGKDNFGYPYCHQGNFPTRNSAGAAPAASSPSRWRCSGPIRRRSACGSTPAERSRLQYRNAIFLARHGSWNRSDEDRRRRRRSSSSTPTARSGRWSRSSPASSRTTTTSAGRSTWCP